MHVDSPEESEKLTRNLNEMNRRYPAQFALSLGLLVEEVGGRGTLQKASAEIERNKHNFVYVKCARAKVFNEN